MKIHYTNHAIERMHKRNVTKNQVVEILQDPDWTEKAKGGREMNTKRYGKREIEVIYKKKQDKYIIVTVRVWVK